MQEKLKRLNFKSQKPSEILAESFRLPNDMIKILGDFLKAYPIQNANIPSQLSQLNLNIDLFTEQTLTLK